VSEKSGDKHQGAGPESSPDDATSGLRGAVREGVSKTSPLAVFDYNHGGRVVLTKERKLAFFFALFFALVLARLFFPFGLLALVLPAMVYLRGERTLKIGARYLICGDRIVYYANVKNLSFSEKEKSICLRSGIKTQLTIEAHRFRVASRSPKIQAEKFAEAVKLMTEGVRRFAPKALAPASERNADDAHGRKEILPAVPIDSPDTPEVAPTGEKRDE
jgi:hypothetical protein